MGDTPASFRELKGVGPATEGRLHEAGVYSWSGLAAVLAALAGVRGADPLQTLADQVEQRLASPKDDPLNGERNEAYVLRLALTTEGRPLRTAVTHVRRQDEQAWPGWRPDELIGFVEGSAGVSAGPPRPATTPSRSPLVGDHRDRDHVVVLDAGTVIGGRRKDVRLNLSAQAADVPEIEYRATLLGRVLGGAPDGERALAGLAGRIRPPSPAKLPFDELDLPSGVLRLRLKLAVRLPAARREAPVLELVAG